MIPSSRNLSYLDRWLSAYESALRNSWSLVANCTNRLAREFAAETPSPASDPATGPAPARQSVVRDSATPGVRIRVVFQTLGRMLRQRRLLRKQVDSLGSGTVGVIAVSTRRLPLAQSSSLRSALHALTLAIPGASQPASIADAIDACEILLLFEPARVSPLWKEPERCWDERVFIVDQAYVCFALLASPIRSLIAMWAHKRRLFAALPRRAPLRNWLLTSVFESGYSITLAGLPRVRAFVLASNSFSTELLRAFLVQAPECTEICEILHGVPTVEFDEYLGAVFRSGPNGGKHRFVPPVPDLPLLPVFESSMAAHDRFAINTTLNRYFLERRTDSEPLIESFDRECRRVFGEASERPPLIVAFTGANSHDANYFESTVFGVECAMIRDARAALEAAGQPFLIIYTPHPLHAWSDLAKNARLRELGVMLHPDTTFTWLVADICLALYSGALWDAAFAGMRAFSPLSLADGFYPTETLDRITYTASGESSPEALARFLRGREQRPGESLHQRVRDRSARFWSSDVTTVCAEVS